MTFSFRDFGKDTSDRGGLSCVDVDPVHVAAGDCDATCPNCSRTCNKAAMHRMPHYCTVDGAWT